jgi:SP family arabinose:H+ symporter-like MFS transporter
MVTNFYIYRICLVATLGGVLFGYDTAVISGAVDALKAHFNLDPIPLGSVISSALIGCIIGVLVAGKLTDWAGRRAVLMLSATLFLVSALACTITHTPDELIAARIIGGIGVGMASLLSPLYIAEISPARIRGAMVSLNQIAILVGMFFSYLANAWIASWGDAAWLNETGWRIMLGAMAIPSVLFLLLTLTIPESPRWLLKRGRAPQAREVLLRINGDGTVVDQEIETIQATIEHEQAKVSELFRPSTRGIVFMTMVLALFQAITGINCVMYYAPTIFTSAGFGTGTALEQSIIISLVMMAFTVASTFLVDRVGRKPIMLFASAGMGISIALLGWGYAASGGSAGSLLIWILTYVASFSIGMGGIYWVVVSEVFPTRVRGVASSLSVVFLWGGNYFVTLFFPVMLKALAGQVFYVFAFMCLLCFFFILWCVPETKGKSLEQIEHDLFKV